MTNNTNQGTNKPGQNPDRDKRKAAPSVPAASRSQQRPTSNQPKPAATGARTTTTPPPRIRPAQPTGSNRPQTQMSARALSRYEKDQKRQRQLVWVTIGVIGFIL